MSIILCENYYIYNIVILVYNNYTKFKKGENLRMKYILNPGAMTAPFFVPASVVDNHIKLATGNQLKVLLCFLKNVTTGTDEKAIASLLKLPESEVLDSLEFWAQSGVISYVNTDDTKAEETPQKKKTVKPVVIKPAREEIALVAATDPRLSFLLQEAEMKLARSMRSGEIQTLAWLYLDHGMDVSLILMLLEYAITEGRATLSFIESTAIGWINAGITTITQAEEEIEARSRRKTAWGMIESTFGIEHRQPSDKELEYAQRWIIDWHFSREMLKEAYNRCIDQKTKISMAYINGILERWFKDGITTLEAAANNENPTAKKGKKNDFGAYDKALVDKLLNNND
jgi:DnaD/phage-associated family protein